MNTIVQTPTNLLKESLDFYSKLEFRIISSKNPVLVSDGKVVIEINPERTARVGVKIFRPSWKPQVNELEKITRVLQIKNGYLLNDPSGTWIYLMENAFDFDTDLSEVPASVLGNFAGLSLEVIHMELSLEIWEILGFAKTMGSVEQGWLTLTNEDGMGISLMKPLSCPHLFFNPSLTFFNGITNLAVIEKIRKLHIPVTEEITQFNKEGIVDNIIIRDPGGFGFFIFSD